MKFQYRAIRPQKTGEVLTLAQKKSWKPCITKGNILNDGRIFPFGFFSTDCLEALRHHNRWVIDVEKRNEIYFEPINENKLGVMNTLWLEAEQQDADRRRKLIDPSYLTEEELRERREQELDEWTDNIFRGCGINPGDTY